MEGKKRDMLTGSLWKLYLTYPRTDDRNVSSARGSPREPRDVTHSPASSGIHTSGLSHFIYLQMFWLYSCGILSFPMPGYSLLLFLYLCQPHDGINHLNWSLDSTGLLLTEMLGLRVAASLKSWPTNSSFQEWVPVYSRDQEALKRKRKNMLRFSSLSFLDMTDVNQQPKTVREAARSHLHHLAVRSPRGNILKWLHKGQPKAG